MFRPRWNVTRTCALALIVCLRCALIEQAAAQEGAPAGELVTRRILLTSWEGGLANHPPAPRAQMGAWTLDNPNVAATPSHVAQMAPMGETWISPPSGQFQYFDANAYATDPAWAGQPMVEAYPAPSPAWFWQVLPDGLIYHSYQAGVHEPRLAILMMSEEGSQSFFDGTLGGRVGLLRYGTADAFYPQGWQLDVEAAAMVRLTLDEIRDFETADYRVGVPITYGIDNWQFKFAAYHLSSHLGDEFAIANPGSLADRINYVRDALVLGASYYPHPVMRLYAEAAYAINVDGGAEPWEFQFGTELSQPGPTGIRGTPFFAINGHLREEHEFGGDVSAQTGWLWRGPSAQVVRAGVHYFNGKSSQYQMFDESEQQVGFGLWYDY